MHNKPFGTACLCIDSGLKPPISSKKCVMRDWAKLSLGVALSSFSYHEHPLPLKQDFHKMWIAAHVKKFPTVESQACRKTYQIHAGELAPFSPSTLQPSFCSSPAAFDVFLCCTLTEVQWNSPSCKDLLKWRFSIFPQTISSWPSLLAGVDTHLNSTV